MSEELIERLTKAAADLDRLAILKHEEYSEFHRLKGKAEGVRLALSYVHEARRTA